MRAPPAMLATFAVPAAIVVLSDCNVPACNEKHGWVMSMFAAKRTATPASIPNGDLQLAGKIAVAAIPKLGSGIGAVRVIPIWIAASLSVRSVTPNAFFHMNGPPVALSFPRLKLRLIRVGATVPRISSGTGVSLDAPVNISV